MNTKSFSLVAPLLLALAGSLCASEASAGWPSYANSWWSAKWPYRQRITVTNGTSAVPQGFTLEQTIANPGAMIQNARRDFEDIRIVRLNGSTWSEVDREIDVDANGALTLHWKAQAAIAANAVDSSYWIYYGNLRAPTAPINLSAIYDRADDFESTPAGSAPTGLSGSPGDWGTWNVTSTLAPTPLRFFSATTSGARYLSSYTAADVDVQIRARANGTTRVASPHVRVSWGPERFYGAVLFTSTDPYRPNQLCIVHYVNGTWNYPVCDTAGTVNAADWHNVRVRAVGSTIEAWGPGDSYASYVDGSITSGQMRLNGGQDHDEFIVKKAVLASPTYALGNAERHHPMRIGQGLTMPYTGTDLNSSWGQTWGSTPDYLDHFVFKISEGNTKDWTDVGPGTGVALPLNGQGGWYPWDPTTAYNRAKEHPEKEWIIGEEPNWYSANACGGAEACNYAYHVRLSERAYAGFLHDFLEKIRAGQDAGLRAQGRSMEDSLRGRVWLGYFVDETASAGCGGGAYAPTKITTYIDRVETEWRNRGYGEAPPVDGIVMGTRPACNTPEAAGGGIAVSSAYWAARQGEAQQRSWLSNLPVWGEAESGRNWTHYDGADGGVCNGSHEYCVLPGGQLRDLGTARSDCFTQNEIKVARCDAARRLKNIVEWGAANPRPWFQGLLWYRNAAWAHFDNGDKRNVLYNPERVNPCAPVNTEAAPQGELTSVGEAFKTGNVPACCDSVAGPSSCTY